jgi:hypothetical protein
VEKSLLLSGNLDVNISKFELLHTNELGLEFLAHLGQVSYYMARCPSSVSGAGFVTTGAMWLILGVMIPLGNTPGGFCNFHDLTYILASRPPS